MPSREGLDTYQTHDLPNTQDLLYASSASEKREFETRSSKIHRNPTIAKRNSHPRYGPLHILFPVLSLPQNAQKENSASEHSSLSHSKKQDWEGEERRLVMGWGTSLHQVTPVVSKNAPSADEPQMTTAEKRELQKISNTNYLGKLHSFSSESALAPSLSQTKCF